VKVKGWIRSAVALLGFLALAAPAHGQDGRAKAALAEAKAALAPGGTPPAEPTAALAELAALEDRLRGADRRRAEAVLSRPEDGQADQFDDGYTVPASQIEIDCSTNFCAHWVETTSDAPPLADDDGVEDGDGVPDIIEQTLASAELSHQVHSAQLGWTEPLSDGSRGGGGVPGRTDIYLIDTDGRFFGYASPDEGQAGPSKHAYLVVDEDMAEFSGVAPLDALRVTIAHEYNHVLQFTYDSLQIGPNLWMLESVATWAEEKVYPGIDDYLRFVPAYASSTRKPLTRDDGGNRIYGEALWNHFVEATAGADAIRAAWQRLPQASPAHFGPSAYDFALGGSGTDPYGEIAETYVGFAASSAEWRASPELYPDAADLTDATRSRRITPGTPARRVRAGALSHMLMRIPVGRAEEGLRLKVRCPAEVTCGAALVGRTGSATAGVVTALTGRATGAPAIAELPGGQYDRATAVVANADAVAGVTTLRTRLTAP
jgi:hypothetical protein